MPPFLSRIGQNFSAMLLAVVFALSLFVSAFFVQPASAFDGIITYQGKLSDDSGVTVTDGNYSIEFALYDASTGGNCLYTAGGACGSASAITVAVAGGFFSVNLGDGTDTNTIDPTIFQSNNVFLGVTIASDSEMTPRKQLNNVGFAYNALYLSGLATSTSGGTGGYIPAADDDGNFTYTGTPTSTAASGGVLYINPSSATADYKLLGLAVGGTEKFSVDEDGDLAASGTAYITGDANVYGDAHLYGRTFIDEDGSETPSTNGLLMLGTSDSSPIGSKDVTLYIKRAQGIGSAEGQIVIQDGAANGGRLVVGYDDNGSDWESAHLALLSSVYTSPGQTRTDFEIRAGRVEIDASSQDGKSTTNSTTPAIIFTDSSGNASAPLLALRHGTTFRAFVYATGSDVLLQSLVSDANGTNAFVVNTHETITAQQNRSLLSIRNSGDEKFSVDGAGTLYSSGSAHLGFDESALSPLLFIDDTNEAVGISSSTPGYGLSVGGTAYFGDTVIMGDSSSDLLTVNATSTFNAGLTINGELTAGTNNTFNIGSYDSAFRDVFASGTAYLEDTVINGEFLFATATPYYSSSTIAGSASDVTIKGGVTQIPPAASVIVGGMTDGTLLNFLDTVQVQGKYAYLVSSSSNFIRIIDITDPANPEIIGGLTDNTNLDGASDLSVRGNYAYVVSNTDDSLRVIDVSDPTNPTIVGGVQDNTDMDGASDVFVSGKYAYVVSTTDDSLRIIDVSDPTNPFIVGGIQDNSNLNLPSDVFVQGKYAFVTSYLDQSLQILDVSDPTHPVIVGEIKDVTNLIAISGVTVSGRYAYTTGGTTNGFFNVIDITDVTAPEIVGTHNGSMQAPRSPVSAGKYVYVVDGTNDALYTFDVEDPENPIIASDLTDTTDLDSVTAVAVLGKYAYISTQNTDAFRVIDLFGSDLSSASIGSVETGRLSVRAEGYIGGNVTIGGGLSVSHGGINSLGDVNILGDLSFASSSKFLSVPANSDGSYGFTFATIGTDIDQGSLARFATTSADGIVGDILEIGYDLEGGNLATTTFTSMVQNQAGATAFHFNSDVALTSSTDSLDRTLLTISNGGTPKFHVGAGGNVYAKNSFIANSTDFGIGDLAEYVDLSPGQAVESGDTIMPDPEFPGKFKKVEDAYSQSAAGVISNTAAFVMGARGENRAALALAGLVNTNVTDENGAIEVGDMLVTASEPGHLMKYDQVGAAGVSAVIVATALEPHEEGMGNIRTLVRSGMTAGSSTLTIGENSDGSISSSTASDLLATSITSTRGTWGVDTDGNMSVKRITAEEYVVEQNLNAPTIGEAVMESGSDSLTIITPAVRDNSKIFVSFLTNLAGRSYHISQKVAGESFTITMSSSLSEYTLLDWWIVQKDGDDLDFEAPQADPVPHDTASDETEPSSPDPVEETEEEILAEDTETPPEEVVEEGTETPMDPEPDTVPEEIPEVDEEPASAEVESAEEQVEQEAVEEEPVTEPEVVPEVTPEPVEEVGIPNIVTPIVEETEPEPEVVVEPEPAIEEVIEETPVEEVNQ